MSNPLYSRAQLEADGLTELTIHPVYDKIGGLATCFEIYGHGEYPPDSVISGQHRRCYLDTYRTAAEALAAYPWAVLCGPKPPLRHIADTGQPSWFDPSDTGESWDIPNPLL